MIEGAVMNRAETQAIFGFVRTPLMFNGNDVGGVEKVQLDVARSAAVIIRSENIPPKTGIANLSLNLLYHRSSWAGGNVLNIRRIRVRDLSNSHDVLRMLRAAMKCFEFVDVGRKKLRTESNRDLVVLSFLRIKVRCLGVLQSFATNLERR